MPRLFVDNLTVIDCSVLDPVRGLIGASWAVNIELFGELDKQSMVFDFAKVKKTIKRIIDTTVDHKLVIPTGFAGYRPHSTSSATQLSFEFETENKEILYHSSPLTAVCTIADQRISRTSVIDYLENIILKELPENVEELTVSLHEESEPGHYYRYSHGLKKHDGNCQRIAHGHRSQIQVWKNGERSSALEKDISRRWHDIYLGSKEDLESQDSTHTSFEYTTTQGDFSIKLPNHRVDIMNCDSTVECIADHLLNSINDQRSTIKVKAFEGIGKGAIASNK